MDTLVRRLLLRIALRACAAAAALSLIGWLAAGAPVAGALAGLVLVLVWELSVQLRAAGELSQLFDSGAGSGGAFSFAELPQQLSDLESRTEEAEQRLKRVLKALQSTARSFPDAALVLNDKGEVVVSNRQARRMLGVRKRLDKGRQALKLIRDPAFVNWLTRGERELVRFKSPELPDTWLEAQRVPYAEKQVLLLVRDVTAAVLADKTRSDFVANASHELQTPLTVLTGYLESMAEDEDFPERWSDPVHHMASQCDRMTRLVRDLLELSRLETSDTAPGLEEVNMMDVLGDAVQVGTARSGGQLDIFAEVTSVRPLLGDEFEIRSVATNLAINAVAFTPPGGKVVLRWETSNGGGRISATDTGIGIRREHLPRLTERFYRVRGEGSPVVPGTGLGLAIVKHVLNRHGGRLEIESEPGSGSTFTCHFPPERVGSGDAP